MGSVWRERLHEWSCRNMSNDQEIVTSKPLKPKGRTELGDVTPHNIKQLKKLNSVVFPVSYNDKVRLSFPSFVEKRFVRLF